MAGPGGAQPFSGTARSCGHFHVGVAEDEHHADGGPQSAVHATHYAVDVAIHVRLFHAEHAQRTAAVLVRLQRNRRGYPVPHSGVGRPDTIAGGTDA